MSIRFCFSSGSLKTTCQQVVFRKPLVNRWFSLKTTCQPVVFLENHLSTGGFPCKPPVSRWFPWKPLVNKWFSGSGPWGWELMIWGSERHSWGEGLKAMNVESFSVSVRSRFGLHSVSILRRFFENHLSAGGFQETTCQQVVFLENHLSTGGFPWKPLVNRWFSLKTTCQPVVFLANHLSAGGFLENHLSTSGFQDLGHGVESWWFEDQNDTLEVKV